MDFVNETSMEAAWTAGFQQDGRELLVVAVKATFVIPEEGQDAALADEQVPLTDSDQFTGKPGFSAPLYESDFAHRKHRCDVLLNGRAYSPGGKAERSIGVSLTVGSMSKKFAVIGHRKWRKGLLSGIQPGEPEPFTVMPISYDCAFGGVDDSQGQPGKIKTYPANPVGRGFRVHEQDIEQISLPNTEEFHAPVTRPDQSYKPLALGAVGRNWQPRCSFAGTYDQQWMDQQMPFLPKDFDDRYFQSAPEDQQLPHPRGGEPVILQNLTPGGVVRFRLPGVKMPIAFIPYQGAVRQLEAALDTILFEPDQGRFMLTWRASVAMRRDCFEMKQVVVGGRSRAWCRAHETGKPYYPGIGALVRARNSRSKA
jgi:hypothetical protein